MQLAQFLGVWALFPGPVVQCARHRPMLCSLVAWGSSWGLDGGARGMDGACVFAGPGHTVACKAH